MALSDCPDCRNALCTCGRQYRGWSSENIVKQIEMLNRILREREPPVIITGCEEYPAPPEASE